MLMMMIMIADFVDSITTPIKSWLDRWVVVSDDHHQITVKEFGVDSARVDCIVCLSDVALEDRYATLERCGHGFHVECVEAWLIDHPNCPLCRTPISCTNENMNKQTVYLKIMSFHVVETAVTWLTGSFSPGLQSTLSESCSYL